VNIMIDLKLSLLAPFNADNLPEDPEDQIVFLQKIAYEITDRTYSSHQWRDRNFVEINFKGSPEGLTVAIKRNDIRYGASDKLIHINFWLYNDMEREEIFAIKNCTQRLLILFPEAMLTSQDNKGYDLNMNSMVPDWYKSKRGYHKRTANPTEWKVKFHKAADTM